MKKKILVIGILSILLLLLPSLASAQIGNDTDNASLQNGPILIICNEGGQLVVKNIGDEPAYNVELSVKLEAAIVFFGSHISGTITVLNPGESEPIRQGFIFGLGPATMTYTVSADNAETFEWRISGYLLGPFFIVF